MDEGFHNQDLAKSTTRHIDGGSWKKQRTIMMIPAGAMIPTKVYLSHRSIIFPPNQAAHFILAEGMEVGDAFTTSIEQVMANPELSQWEYLLTIEHDNCPPADGLVKLIRRMEQHPEFDCIGGLYWTKGPGGVPQIWGDIKDPVMNFRPQPPDPNGGLVECWGTGMGFNLWRLKMFKDERIKKPWFKTGNGLDGQGVSTQDLAFWSEARKWGHRCAIDCDVKVGHWDEAGSYGPPRTMW